MPYEFGDVVLVRFPFTNQSSSKQRPAVVVISRAYNAAKLDIVIMAITSQLRAVGFGEVAVAEWQRASLLKPSAIKPVFATIERSLVLKRLGVLQPSDQSALRTAIASVLG
jgi:mRNA interferase MazF